MTVKNDRFLGCFKGKQSWAAVRTNLKTDWDQLMKMQARQLKNCCRLQKNIADYLAKKSIQRQWVFGGKATELFWAYMVKKECALVLRGRNRSEWSYWDIRSRLISIFPCMSSLFILLSHWHEKKVGRRINCPRETLSPSCICFQGKILRNQTWG